MLRIFIFRSVFFLSGVVSYYGQKGLNDSLLIYEYKYFKQANDSLKQQILLQKINLYLRAGITSTDVFNDIKRINTNILNRDESYFLWNSAIISYLNNENDYARFFMAEYNAITKDTSVDAGIMNILVNKYSDTSVARQQIKILSMKDSLFRNLACFEAIAGYSKRYRDLYLISSALLPGSGAALNGYVLKGIFSFVIVSSSVYAIIKMVEYGLYLNAVLWGSGVGVKFYGGNINLTEKLFYKAEAKKKAKLNVSCEACLKTILDKYPLILKLK